MDRREALQLLMGGAALQLVSGDVFARLHEARMQLGTYPALRTLDSHQNATVTAIAEMIIPKTDTSGAADVGVSQFVDLILTEWYTKEERDRFLHGLADIDLRTHALFEKEFVASSPDQRAQILTKLGAEMIEDERAVRSSAQRYRGSLPMPTENFYYMLRSLTLTAYYTSEAGAGQELRFQVVPDRD
jgi:hypothetical protein